MLCSSVILWIHSGAGYTTSGSDFCESFRTFKTFQKSGSCHERTGKEPGQRSNV